MEKRLPKNFLKKCVVMKSVNLIYVLSNGRSGSTLVDMLFGSDSSCFTLGEAQDLYWNLELKKTSGRGLLLKECPFWGHVIEGFDDLKEIKEISLFREQYGRGKVLRWPLLKWVLFGRFPKKLRALVDSYVSVNEKYLILCRNSASEVQDQMPEWLIDASKDPYRLLFLSQSKRINLKVIHILKRPEAFVHSMTKNLSKGRLPYSLRMAIRWCVENYIMFKVRERFVGSKESGITVSYERLASEPERVLGEICSSLDLDLDSEEMLRFREKENFAISGNKMRSDTRPVTLDEKWRVEMPPFIRFLVSAVSLIPRKAFVFKYGLR